MYPTVHITCKHVTYGLIQATVIYTCHHYSEINFVSIHLNLTCIGLSAQAHVDANHRHRYTWIPIDGIILSMPYILFSKCRSPPTYSKPRYSTYPFIHAASALAAASASLAARHWFQRPRSLVCYQVFRSTLGS